MTETPPQVGAWRALTDRLANGESIPRPVLLRAAADALEAGADRERFTMRYFRHECGTPACAAGHLYEWTMLLNYDVDAELSGDSRERWGYLFRYLGFNEGCRRDGPSALDDAIARLRWLADHPDTTYSELLKAPETAEEAAEMKGRGDEQP